MIVINNSAFGRVADELVESRAAQHEPRKKKEKTEARTCKTLFVVVGWGPLSTHAAQLWKGYSYSHGGFNLFSRWAPNSQPNNFFHSVLIDPYLSGLVAAVLYPIRSPGAVCMVLTSVNSLRGCGFQTKHVCWIHTSLAHCSSSHVSGCFTVADWLTLKCLHHNVCLLSPPRWAPANGFMLHTSRKASHMFSREAASFHSFVTVASHTRTHRLKYLKENAIQSFLFICNIDLPMRCLKGLRASDLMWHEQISSVPRNLISLLRKHLTTSS